MRYLSIKLLIIFLFLSYSPMATAYGDPVYDKIDAKIIPAKVNIEKWKKKSGNITILSPDKEKESTRIEVQSPNWVGILIEIISYLIIALVVLLTIYLLIQTFNEEEFKFRKSIKTDNNENNYIVESLTHETPIHQLKNALEKSIENNDLRATIRIQYIIIIRQLINIRLISWQKNKTNLDYINELKSGKLRNEFIGLTLDYERVWYGKHFLSDELIKTNNNRYQNLINTIKTTPKHE